MTGRVLRPCPKHVTDLFVEALLEAWPDMPMRYAVIRLTDLRHIVADTRPENLARLRAEWDERRYEPIRLIKRPGEPVQIRNGRHRLTIARERGYARVAVLVLYDGIEL